MASDSSQIFPTAWPFPRNSSPMKPIYKVYATFVKVFLIKRQCYLQYIASYSWLIIRATTKRTLASVLPGCAAILSLCSCSVSSLPYSSK